MRKVPSTLTACPRLENAVIATEKKRHGGTGFSGALALRGAFGGVCLRCTCQRFCTDT
jgi:hypothetical protein